MNEMKIFENPRFGEIRVIEKGGELWFVAADVCRALELEDTGRATSRLDANELTRIKIVSGGQNREVIVVNEPGVYSLVLGSRKPEAKAFKRWVTHEVIPSIRKNGGYVFGQESMTPEELMATALTVAQKVLAEREERLSALAAENQLMKPKADYFDELVSRNLLTNFRDTAKQLGIKPKTFISELLRLKYIYRDQRGKLMPYQTHIDSGTFEVWSGPQTRVTPKGRETFRLLFTNLKKRLG